MNHDYETRQILRKEPIYRKLYSSLLQEHRGILQQAQPTKDENSTTTTTTTITTQHHYDDTNHQQQHNQFEDEDQILNTIFQTEMKNMLVGVGASVAAVASLRFVRSSYASSTVFGSVKAKAMQEAEREGKKRGTDTFQKNFSYLVEGTFSIWVGYRCYDYTSHRSKDSMNAIAELPLCSGRSRVADALCPEWNQITNTQIPASFWQALEDGKIQDERTWFAIQSFSTNCERRLAVEKSIRSRDLSIPGEQPVVLTERVPSEEEKVLSDIVNA